jgi:hypothetical protein
MARSNRLSIAGLMGAVLVTALGLAALRNNSETWAGIMFLVTWGLIVLAVVGIVCRGGAERAWWLGFALFGSGYMKLVYFSPEKTPPVTLPTAILLRLLDLELGLPIEFFDNPKPGASALSFMQIGHCLWALIAAVLGGLLAVACFGAAAGRAASLGAEQPPPADAPRKWWVRPAIIGLAGFALVASVAVAGASGPPGLWAGATFLLTWALIGVAVLGALLGRGKRRETWLGAALFGAGFMMLAFDQPPHFEPWPNNPTIPLLNSLRPGFPPFVTGFPHDWRQRAAANARILKALEQPVSARFEEETSLEDVLKYVADATRGPDGKGIPMYVDPMGLNAADKTLVSTVRNIKLDGVPLSTILSLCLNQVDLKYEVRDGALFITWAGEVSSVSADPFLIVGQCLLALIVAGIGGVLAPVVSDWRREPTPPAALPEAG